MDLKLINDNIVVIYEDFVADISTDETKAAIATVFDDEDTKPVIAQFPEVMAINIPEIAISIILERKKLIISDQSIGDFEKRDNVKFVTLLDKIHKIIGKNSVMHGFNYIYQIDGKFEEISKNIQDKFFKEIGEQLPPTSEFKFALPNLMFGLNDAEVSLSFQTIRPEKAGITPRMQAVVNVHFKTPLSELDILGNNFKAFNKDVTTFLSKTIQ